MKKLLLGLFFALGSMSIHAQNAKVIIKGAIKDTLYLSTFAPTKEIPVKNFNKFVFGTNQPENQTFEIPQEICTENRFYLSANHNYTFFEVKPGQTITVDLQGSEMKFSGDNTKINQYLFDWVQINIKGFENGLKFRWHMANKFAKYKNFLPKDVSIYQNQPKLKTLYQDCMTQLNQSGITDTDFLTRQKTWIKYLPYHMHCENYLMAYGYKLPITDNYKAYLKNWKFDDADLLQYPDVDRVLNTYFRAQDELFDIKSTLPTELADHAKVISNQSVREYFILNELTYLVRADMAFELDRIAESAAPLLKSESAKKSYAEKLPAIKDLAAKNLTGQRAFNFSYEDKNGKTVKLSDFKGKYVFIDLWATWCGPCIANIPFVNKLEHELKDSNIAFVSISFDKLADKAKWQKFVASNEMGEIQLISNDSFKGEMGTFYGVNSIPRFILVDPNGNLISAKCRQPMNKPFREYVIELVRSNKTSL